VKLWIAALLVAAMTCTAAAAQQDGSFWVHQPSYNPVAMKQAAKSKRPIASTPQKQDTLQNSLVRLLVVFHFLRQALGTQTAPSNQVLMGLALMMTWFLVQPVLTQVDQVAVTPYRAGTIDAMDAMERGSVPVKAYLLRFAREKDLAVFVKASATPRPASAADLPMSIVVPAYILSELKAGFQIGAVLFLPFLLVDFLVASITTSIGMLQLSPIIISTPVKVLLFVMVDGWSLLARELLKSF
jgi:flagellar biosynthetic protein FliP